MELNSTGMTYREGHNGYDITNPGVAQLSYTFKARSSLRHAVMLQTVSSGWSEHNDV